MRTKLIALFTILTLSVSCLKQGNTVSIEGVNGPLINVVNGKILFSVGLENLNLPIGVSLPLSNELKGGSVTVGPDLENGGSMIQVAFNADSLNSDYFEVVPGNTLPNGDIFPFTLSGELPAHAINIPEALDITVYASNKLFGFFVPVKFPDYITFGAYYPLSIGGKEVGHFTVVGNNSAGEGSGIIVMLSMEQVLANKDLQTAIKYSKKRKYKNRVF